MVGKPLLPTVSSIFPPLLNSIRLTESLAAGETVLDLAGVGFIDSSGIALLVYISQTPREHVRRLELRNPSPHVEKLIKLGEIRCLRLRC